jgi:hypothetical protein
MGGTVLAGEDHVQRGWGRQMREPGHAPEPRENPWQQAPRGQQP